MKKLSTTYSMDNHEIILLSNAIKAKMDKDTFNQVSFNYSIGLFEMIVVVDRVDLGCVYLSFFSNDGTDIVINEMEELYRIIHE